MVYTIILFFSFSNLATIVSQQQQYYYQYPQDYFYQRRIYYQQQQQIPQQQQYFAQYFPQQQQLQQAQQHAQQQQNAALIQQQQQFVPQQPQQQFVQIPQTSQQRQIYVEQQRTASIPQQQQFVQNTPQQQQQFVQQLFQQQQQQRQQQIAAQNQAIVISMEATPPAQLSPKPVSQTPTTSALGPEQLEFDLPPPPLARFLPDETDRIRIAELLAEEHRAEQIARQRAAQQQRHQQQQQLLLEQQRQQQQQQILLQQQQQQQRLLQEQQEQQVLQTRLRNEQQQQQQKEQMRLKEEEERRKTVEIAEFSHDSAPTVSHLLPTKADPNGVFLNCCKKKKVNKKCESRCNFDVLNKKILTQMFLGTDPCPQSNGLDLFTCAAQAGDHTPCCRSKQVDRTAAGDKCLAFCNLTPNANFQADPSYLPCWAVLNDVKSCFKDAIVRNGETIRV